MRLYIKGILSSSIGDQEGDFLFKMMIFITVLALVVVGFRMTVLPGKRTFRDDTQNRMKIASPIRYRNIKGKALYL